MKEKNIKYWVTKEGEQMRIGQMKTSHILNVINCLHGKGKTELSQTALDNKDVLLSVFNKELRGRGYFKNTLKLYKLL